MKVKIEFSTLQKICVRHVGGKCHTMAKRQPEECSVDNCPLL